MSDQSGEEATGLAPFTFHRRAMLAAAGVTASAVAMPGALLPLTAAADQPDDRRGVDQPTFPPQLTELQPGNPADLQKFLDYEVANDPNAPYLRCDVPLARRATLPATTQANPRLSPDPQVLSLNPYYRLLDMRSSARELKNDRFGVGQRPYITRFAQYQDILGGWMGAQLIPNPAWVDTAHRNGTLALGILYQPYFSTTNPDILIKDDQGNFLVGDKMVDLAEHFGFDGYFLNIEGKTISEQKAAELAAMFDGMHRRAEEKGLPNFHLQIYDALWTNGAGRYDNKFTKNNSGWIKPGSRVDSMFINYAWPINFVEAGWQHPGVDYVEPSLTEADRVGLDPFATLYFGLDIQEENDRVHANALDMYANEIIPVNGAGAPRASLALFTQADSMIRRINGYLGQMPSAPTATVEEMYVADRKFWSGASENPAIPVTPVDPDPKKVVRPDWEPRYGMANFIPERTVITEPPFVTRFNTGQGDHFQLAGARADDQVWYNMGIQDILPTWQWWRRDRSGKAQSDSLLMIDYDHDFAYDGPNCLKVSGQLSASSSTEFRLYKTSLDAGRPITVALIARAGTDDALDALRVGLSYLDDPEQTTWIDDRLPIRKLGHGWVRLEFNPRPRQGEVITALSIGVITDSGSADDFTVRLGELSVQRRNTSQGPSRPAEVRVAASYPSESGRGLTVGLQWKLDPEVWYYDLRTSGDAPRWLGRISSAAYVLDGLSPGSDVAVIAVGRDGSESTPATVTVT
ncbi:hypothetical protein [Microlunatus sp. GCM10028923]|uniref:endo-beta-N-acetylglucosaminidase n=1 Tax=Microlunatus sp. GCM10028923 TaxID=3273400 RepID=UPI00360E4B4D